MSGQRFSWIKEYEKLGVAYRAELQANITEAKGDEVKLAELNLASEAKCFGRDRGRNAFEALGAHLFRECELARSYPSPGRLWSAPCR